MRPKPLAAAASLLAFLVSLSLAAPAAADCQVVLATANTTWVDDTGVEVGKIQGFINGAFYLNYDDEHVFTEDRRANLVIVTDQGELRIWTTGKSFLGEDGSSERRLTTARAEGTRSFAGATIVLDLEGTFEVGSGGSYQVSGSICPNEIQPRG
jgi:hypothetical protein